MSTSISGSDRLDAEERRELPDSAFGIPETHEFPMPDAAHVRAAEAYFRYAPENKKSELARNILAKAVNTVSMSKVKRSFPGPGTNSSRKPFPRPRDALAPPKLSAQAVASLLRLLF